MSKDKHNGDTTAQRTVSREDYVKDPGAVLRRAKAEGPITLVDERGRARATITAPSDRRPVD